jgi:hypothetical protein
VIVILPSSEFILLRLVLCSSSSAAAAVSARIVKIVAYRRLDASIIFFTFSVLGIIGVPSGVL